MPHQSSHMFSGGFKILNTRKPTHKVTCENPRRILCAVSTFYSLLQMNTQILRGYLDFHVYFHENRYVIFVLVLNRLEDFPSVILQNLEHFFGLKKVGFFI